MAEKYMCTLVTTRFEFMTSKLVIYSTCLFVFFYTIAFDSMITRKPMKLASRHFQLALHLAPIRGITIRHL